MRIGLFIGSFAGGGAEKMMVNLAKGLYQKGMEPVIYVVNATGPYYKEVPKDIKIYSYNAKYGVKSIIHKIRRTLKKDELSALISTQMHINAAVGLASISLNNTPKLIFREANIPSRLSDSYFRGFIYRMMYRFATHYIAISKGVKDNMIKYYGIEAENITTIFSPVIASNVSQLARQEPTHSWLKNKKAPTFVAMGRIIPQKDFATLIKAIAILQEKINCQLIIYGKVKDQEYFKRLNKLIDNLNLEDVVDFGGFTSNPFSAFYNADLFIQTSLYEGFGNSLVEAMAVGCPVISTDCPSGPREILKNGKYGALVEVGDYQGLAQAILNILNKPLDPEFLKKRAHYFSIEKSTSEYLKLINSLNAN